MLSCPTHFHDILALQNAVEKDKSKKKHLYHMYDDFYAHLVWNYLNIQESNMTQKLKGLHSYIYTEKTYRLSKYSEFIVKDMDSSKNWRRYVPLHTF